VLRMRRRKKLRRRAKKKKKVTWASTCLTKLDDTPFRLAGEP
jgi:hypothetical protein